MIGSYWGAIGAAEYKRIQNKPSAELTPYECIVQGVIGIPTDATILEPVAKARECLERLTRDEPRNAAAWAALVLVFNSQRTWGFPFADRRRGQRRGPPLSGRYGGRSGKPRRRDCAE